MTALAIDPRGLKRICPSCGTQYYDLNKRPIECPSCATEFTGEIKVKTRRGRVAADAVAELPPEERDVERDEEDLLEEEDAEAEVVSLDDLDEGDDNAEDDDSMDLDDEDDDIDLDDEDDDLGAGIDDMDDEDDDMDVDLDDEEDR